MVTVSELAGGATVWRLLGIELPDFIFIRDCFINTG